MKIGAENFFNIHSSVPARDMPAPHQSGATPETERGRFDRVTLTGTERETEERLFAGRLTEELKSTIAEHDDSKRLEALREAVKNGTYRADSREIATRLLLFGGEDR